MDGECDFGAVGLESVEGAFFARRQGDVGVVLLVVAQVAEFLDGVNAEGVVGGGAEVPGEGHDAAPAVVRPVAGFADPAPEESAALVVDERFGAGQQAAEVAEATVAFGVELLILVAADVVLGPAVGLVGVHEEHVLVAEGEEVGAGAVFDFVGQAAVGLVEGAEVLPVHQVG